MVKLENECVDCGLPCLGNSCPYRNVKRFYFDECGEEVGELGVFEDMQLCQECHWKHVEKVEE